MGAGKSLLISSQMARERGQEVGRVGQPALRIGVPDQLEIRMK